MKPDFAQRHDLVLDLFRILTAEAKAQKQNLVFIGGSAVQSVLKKPRRLSIDLDVWYSGDSDALMASLGPEFSLESRKNKTDLFRFYSVTRKSDDVFVKVDFLRHPLLMQESPYGKHTISSPGGSFGGYAASPEYLLASKLVALAVNTLGRRKKERFVSDFIKDVLDANSLLDEYGLSDNVWPYFWGVCRVQNKFFETNFSQKDVEADAVKLLVDAAATSGADLLFKARDFDNFAEYTLNYDLTKFEFSVLCCRLAACLSCMNALDGSKVVEAFSKIEKVVRAQSSNPSFLLGLEAELVAKGQPASYVKSMRLLAPRALIYLHGSTFPEKYSK